MKPKKRFVDADAEIRNIIGQILADEVIVNSQFTIAAAGEDIGSALGFERGHFSGRPVSDLLGSALPPTRLTSLLKPGYFMDYHLRLKTVSGEFIPFTMSGFYVRMINPSNGLIILKLQTAAAAAHDSASNRLNIALDEFIYATSHSLRGPLATLKGLISLFAISSADDHAFLLEKMRHHADKLDDRLHKLIYFAEVDKTDEFLEGELTLESIAAKLGCSEDIGYRVKDVRFKAALPEYTEQLQNGKLILALLQNIQSFFFRHATQPCDMDFHIHIKDTGYEFELSASGIALTEEQYQKAEVINLGYSEILSDPDYTDIYAAKKIILKLHGQLRLHADDQRMKALIFIPSYIPGQ